MPECIARERLRDLMDAFDEMEARQRAVVRWIEDTGCTCDSTFHYASLADHENACPAQVELILRSEDV